MTAVLITGPSLGFGQVQSSPRPYAKSSIQSSSALRSTQVNTIQPGPQNFGMTQLQNQSQNQVESADPRVLTTLPSLQQAPRGNRWSRLPPKIPAAVNDPPIVVQEFAMNGNTALPALNQAVSAMSSASSSSAGVPYYLQQNSSAHSGFAYPENQVSSNLANQRAIANLPTKVWMRGEDGSWAKTILLRKLIRIDSPISGTVQIEGDCPFELFCNGRQMASGNAGPGNNTVDVTNALRNGDNVIAVRSQRVTAESPGVGIRFQYHTALTKQTIETDSTWVVAQRALPMWKTHLYSDRNWNEATVVSTASGSKGSVSGGLPPSTLPVVEATPSALAKSAASQGSSLATAPRQFGGGNQSAVPVSVGPDLGNASDARVRKIGDSSSTASIGKSMQSNSSPAIESSRKAETASQLVATADTTQPDAVDAKVESNENVPKLETALASFDSAAADSTASQSADILLISGTEVAKADVADVADVDAGTSSAGMSSVTEGSIDPSINQEGSQAGIAANHGGSAVSNQDADSGASANSQSTIENQQTTLDSPTVPGTGSRAGSLPGSPVSPSGTDIQLKVPENFVVEPIASSSIGSLIAIEFDEFGRILASKEAGGLIRVDLTVPLDDPARVTEVCNSVKAIQGILPLNGSIYVTGLGDQGLGVYLLEDKEGDFFYEQATKICGFSGSPGEHGPHALNLGADRMLYVLLGNHTQVEGQLAPNSMVKHFYEGDTVDRYEDPGGHAVGIKSPGGTLIRMTLDGSRKEIVASGIRNAYDFAFNSEGEIFLHDSDMESDEGTSWYRPTQLFHVVGGADFGWRSGWGKWPSYYPDTVAPIAKTGRGSPSGSVIYDHVRFPEQYRGSIFLGDWTNGRVLAVNPKRKGASYETTVETFMEGRPLNVTDLAVGPEDGGLYIALGGRDSSGGIYRVRWVGDVAPQLISYGSLWEEVIRTPHFYSAAARQRIATLRLKLDGSWDTTLRSIATNENNVDSYRIRALDVMQWFGPSPDTGILSDLSVGKSVVVRAKVATVLGTRREPICQIILQKMLSDPEPLIQRLACEGLVRTMAKIEPQQILPLLASDDRNVSFAARRLLENQPVQQWRSLISTTQDPRVFVQLSIALMIAQPNLKNAYDVLVGVNSHLDQELSEDEYLSLMRVTQLALRQGNVEWDKIPAFRKRIADDFPTNNSQINRELVYVLTYLKSTDFAQRYVDYLKDDNVPYVDRFHLAIHMQQIGTQLDAQTRNHFLQFLEQARTKPGGGSYEHYLIQASRDLSKSIPSDQATVIVAAGDQMPNAALMMLSQLQKPIQSQTLDMLQVLEQKLATKSDVASRELKIGLVAVLGEALNDNPSVADQLIEIWKNDPNRREFVALALAQCPPAKFQVGADQSDVPTSDTATDSSSTSAALLLASQKIGKPAQELQPSPPLDSKSIQSVEKYAEQHWTYLIGSLPILSGNSAADVLSSMANVDRTSSHPDHIRQVILLGVKYPNAASAAANLLQKWTQQSVSSESPGNMIGAWQQWYAGRYPDQLPATLPNESETSKWTIEEIQKQLKLLEVDFESGQQIYTQVQCASCHSMGSGGSSFGPELSTLAKRFSRREIIEAIVHPSHTISDRYRSEIIMTDDGKIYAGIVSQIPGGKIAIIDRDAKRIEVAKADILEMKTSSQSIMPSGLLDSLNAQQVVDLIGFLEAGKVETIANAQGDVTTDR